MTKQTKPMSLIEALTAPMQQMLQQVKTAAESPAPHWTDYLRSDHGDKN